MNDNIQVIYKNIADLKAYDNNPRNNKRAVDYVANSIKAFGFKNPIIIDKDNVIVCGHTRRLAAIELGLINVPCIIADDLSEAEIKAFRLADNKVAEMAEWDNDLLSLELSNIVDFEMADFGFDLSFDDDFADDDEIDDEEKENERMRTNNAYNLELFNPQYADGYYQMPFIACNNFIPDRLIGFNYAKSSQEKKTGIHFFIDDYQFERVWNNPLEYLDILKQYDCILSPDFSLYMDMPIAMKIWNIYRSRMIGQYYQRCGIKVIPTLSWAEPATFRFAFDGIPENSIVAISTIGVKRDNEAFKIWKTGVDYMLKKLKPKAILCYGGKVDYDFGNIDVYFYGNEVTERMIKQKREENTNVN